MYLVYSALALAEVFVLFAAIIGVLFFIVRGIIRAFCKSDDETKKVAPESLQHLKRAGAGQRG
jgi:hypothetical protein